MLNERILRFFEAQGMGLIGELPDCNL